jgi:hypothetical protein
VRRWHRAAALAAGPLLAATLFAACATEVDPEIPAPASASTPVTTEFVASGSTAELIDQLVAEAGTLSEAIVTNEGQHEIIGRIDVIWASARPGVEQADPNIVSEFDQAIELMHTGVDRRRPADADKAYTNLTQLVAAL